jgi:DNA modification methylase
MPPIKDHRPPARREWCRAYRHNAGGTRLTLFYHEPLVDLHIGNCLLVLATLPEKSVHCVITSPPYWSLRDYQTEPQIWGGGDDCEHVWGEQAQRRVGRNDDDFNARTQGQYGKWSAVHTYATNQPKTSTSGTFCQCCHAWLGHLGLEPTPFCTAAMQGQDCADQCYLGHLLQVADGLFRVLRDNGTLWWNISDSYCSTDKWGGGKSGNSGKHTVADNGDVPSWTVRQRREPVPGLAPKNLMNIPARFSIAMQARGWTLRSEIRWLKASSMPESVQDRPSVSHETVFLFSKGATYFYDHDAVRHENTNIPRTRERPNGAPTFAKFGYNTSCGQNPNGRTRRTGDWWYESLDAVIADTESWLAHAKQVRVHGGMLLSPEGEPLGLNVNPQSYAGAHFATFPEKLVTPMVLASTSSYGACSQCLSPWQRVTTREGIVSSPVITDGRKDLHGPTYARHRQSIPGGQSLVGFSSATVAWFPTCACGGYRIDQKVLGDPLPTDPGFWQAMQAQIKALWPAVVPCVALDPFGGRGTVAKVARHLGRRSVLIELSVEYCQLAKDYLHADLPLFSDAPASQNGQNVTQAEMSFDAE